MIVLLSLAACTTDQQLDAWSADHHFHVQAVLDDPKPVAGEVAIELSVIDGPWLELDSVEVAATMAAHDHAEVASYATRQEDAWFVLLDLGMPGRWTLEVAGTVGEASDRASLSLEVW